MPLPVLGHKKLHFLSLGADAFDAQAKAWGWPAFRAQQVRDWTYGKLVSDPTALANLSKEVREGLARDVEIAPADVTAHQSSADGTEKLLLSWADGANAETVM